MKTKNLVLSILFAVVTCWITCGIILFPFLSPAVPYILYGAAILFSIFFACVGKRYFTVLSILTILMPFVPLFTARVIYGFGERIYHMRELQFGFWGEFGYTVSVIIGITVFCVSFLLWKWTLTRQKEG